MQGKGDCALTLCIGACSEWIPQIGRSKLFLSSPKSPSPSLSLPMTVPPLGSPSIPRHDSADETSSSSNSVVVETAAQVETLTILPAVQPERSGSDLTGVAAEIGGMPPPKARLKVPLEKGYSQMVWLRLLQTEPDLAGPSLSLLFLSFCSWQSFI